MPSIRYRQCRHTFAKVQKINQTYVTLTTCSTINNNKYEGILKFIINFAFNRYYKNK